MRDWIRGLHLRARFACWCHCLRYMLAGHCRKTFHDERGRLIGLECTCGKAWLKVPIPNDFWFWVNALPRPKNPIRGLRTDGN